MGGFFIVISSFVPVEGMHSNPSPATEGDLRPKPSERSERGKGDLRPKPSDRSERGKGDLRPKPSERSERGKTNPP
jgi:hypothetical protein